MKAIVNVNKHSAYADINGLTFDVKEMRMAQIDLIIEGKTTTFGHSEVIICDFQTEMHLAHFAYVTDPHKFPKDGITYDNLVQYAVVNRMHSKNYIYE